MMKKIFQGSVLKDPSLWFLLLSNLITIFFAIKQGWDLSIIMWIYWFQSIIIGFFNFTRIIKLKEFSTEGVKLNNRPLEPTQDAKIYVAFFFLIHYGFFHFVYSIFLLAETYSKISGHGIKIILLAALLFFINHFFSYIYNKPRDTKKQNIGKLMLYPYARIIPMHFTIILGSAFGSVLIFFLLLKTFADCAMHITEHKIFRR